MGWESKVPLSALHGLVAVISEVQRASDLAGHGGLVSCPPIPRSNPEVAKTLHCPHTQSFFVSLAHREEAATMALNGTLLSFLQWYTCFFSSGIS